MSSRSKKRGTATARPRSRFRIGYAKIYWKTILATVMATLVFVGLVQGLVPPRLGIWALVNLSAFIIINEKFTRGERWGMGQIIAMLLILLASTYLLLALS